MSTGPTRAQGAKAALFVWFGMFLFGLSGALGSAGQLTSRNASPLIAHDNITPEVAEQLEALMEEVWSGHRDEAAAVANLLVSSLLILASFTLTLRRRTAHWWVRQALLANVLYTAAYTAIEISFVLEYTERFVLLALQAQEPLPDGITGDDVVGAMLWLACALVIFRGLLLIAFYLGLLRIARRPDVQAFTAPPDAAA